MKRPWIPEREVTIEMARRLIEASAFPGLEIERIDLLGVGWDNIAYLVNGELVFRFPQRSLGAELMQSEIAVLPALAGRLPLEVPRLEWIGEPRDDYPWRFAGYRFLRGTTADGARLDDAARIAAAEPLADFLAALHSIRDVAAPPDRIEKLDLPRLTRLNRDRLREISDLIEVAPILRALEGTSISRPIDTGTLVHGDLYARHLLIDGDRLSGVIDWGDVGRADRAVDLSLAYGFLPEAARERFFARYGEVDADTHALARFRAIHIGLAIVIHGREIGDDDLLGEGMFALRRA